MFPIGGLRLALLAWSNRRPVTRVLLGAVGLALAVPALFAVLLTAVVAGARDDGLAIVDGVAAPMAHWSVSQGFGCTGFYLEPARGACPHFHAGVDMVAPTGMPVRAVLPGLAQVVLTGGYGLHVLITHDGGLLSLYGHLGRVDVAPGERVTAGQVIGAEGSTGASTGPHLHFEVRRDGEPVDPASAFPGLFAVPRASTGSTGASPVA
ncbi:MAG: hypothetical protein QOE92_146 [Chloroflexota bacterium]|jgi:murein DD-endopeptidase MepM/ murein hydrolase activator NlpD|nr:hypothetical protein [Chloroflexota bacterium]